MKAPCHCCGDAPILKQNLCKECYYSITSRFVAIHFRPNRPANRLSACSVAFPAAYAYDGRHVTCKRCMRTKAWKVYMGKDCK